MSNDETILVAIVVYNKTISNSIACKNIQTFNLNNVNILIIDNGEIDTENVHYCEKASIDYISMHGNAGLSKAYNVAVDYAQEKHYDVIVLMDDDTPVTKDYFDSLHIALQEQPEIDIFAPIVYGQDGVIYSPNEFSFLRNHFIESPHQNVIQEKFNAIASCLAIRIRVFDGYRFNEILFVDQVDQFFFCEQRERGKKFAKLMVEVKQNFYQREKHLSEDVAWRRLRLRIIDIMRHARLMNEFKYIILGFVKNLGLGLQLGLKTKSIKLIIKAIGLSVKQLLCK